MISPPSGLDPNVPAASTPRNAMGRAQSLGTQGPPARRRLAESATRSATRVVMAGLLWAELGIASLLISLMFAQAKVLSTTVRRMCLLPRDAVLLEPTSWILMSVRIRLSLGQAGPAAVPIWTSVLRLAAVNKPELAIWWNWG